LNVSQVLIHWLSHLTVTNVHLGMNVPRQELLSLNLVSLVLIHLEGSVNALSALPIIHALISQLSPAPLTKLLTKEMDSVITSKEARQVL
jgi:hypothetical protein